MIQLKLNRPWFIYVLRDPRNNEIRYVGWTHSPQRRLRQHITNAYKRSAGKNRHKDNWIVLLATSTLMPILEVVESGVSKHGWIDAEQKHIKILRGNGTNLLNKTDGGEGVLNLSQDARHSIAIKVSKIHKGRKFTTEHRAAISAALKGKRKRPHTEQEKLKISASMKGRPHPLSEQALERRKANPHRGYKLKISPERRAQMVEVGRRVGLSGLGPIAHTANCLRRKQVAGN